MKEKDRNTDKQMQLIDMTTIFVSVSRRLVEAWRALVGEKHKQTSVEEKQVIRRARKAQRANYSHGRTGGGGGTFGFRVKNQYDKNRKELFGDLQMRIILMMM